MAEESYHGTSHAAARAALSPYVRARRLPDRASALPARPGRAAPHGHAGRPVVFARGQDHGRVAAAMKLIGPALLLLAGCTSAAPHAGGAWVYWFGTDKTGETGATAWEPRQAFSSEKECKAVAADTLRGAAELLRKNPWNDAVTLHEAAGSIVVYPRASDKEITVIRHVCFPDTVQPTTAKPTK
jgi:hypothetical protein